MAENTKIEWADFTFNPWIGCMRISNGPLGACDNCYAAAMAKAYGWAKFGGPGEGVGERDRTSEANWKKPLKWEREAAAKRRAWFAPEGPPNGGMGRPFPYSPFVFCASLADVFDKDVPTAWRRDLIGLWRATPHLTWLPLTKRAPNVYRLFCHAVETPDPRRWPPGESAADHWPRNAALGFTAVTQDEFDRDWPHMRAAFEALRPAFIFLSYEPGMGPVVLPPDFLALGGRAWVIAGFESGPKARPGHPDWARALRDQCAAAGVPFLFKQWGEHHPHGQTLADGSINCLGNPDDGRWTSLGDEVSTWRVGKKRAGRLLDGVEHNARPEVAHG